MTRPISLPRATSAPHNSSAPRKNFLKTSSLWPSPAGWCSQMSGYEATAWFFAFNAELCSFSPPGALLKIYVSQL